MELDRLPTGKVPMELRRRAHLLPALAEEIVEELEWLESQPQPV